MHPKTDIICLVHNALGVTKDFARSLFSNTENFRLIFVNNGSDDETSQWLQQGVDDGRWELVDAGKNLGVIGGRNLGATFIKSDYFLNIDNDQYVGSNWLQGLHDLMESGYDIVGCEAWHLMKPGVSGAVIIDGKVANQDRSYYPHRHCSKRTEEFTYIGCGGMLVKKKVYDDIGMFDERFSPAYFEDPDFCWRANQAGYKLGWKQDCPIMHLAHQTIGSQKTFDKHKQFLKSWRAFRKKWQPYYPVFSMRGSP